MVARRGCSVLVRLLPAGAALQLRRQRRQDRCLADHQDPDEPLLRVDEAGRAGGSGQERRPPVGGGRAGRRRHPVPDQRDRHRHRPRRQGHPDHLQRSGGQRGAAPGQGLRAVRDRPRHAAGPGEDRRRHLRDQQLPGRQADRRVRRRQARRQAGRDRDAGPLRRPGRLRRHRPRPRVPHRHGHRPGQQDTERQGGAHGQVHRRQGRQLHDRLPPGDPGRGRRWPQGDGAVPVAQPRHQRRLHDQRARRRGRLRRAQGRQPPGQDLHRLHRRQLPGHGGRGERHLRRRRDAVPGQDGAARRRRDRQDRGRARRRPPSPRARTTSTPAPSSSPRSRSTASRARHPTRARRRAGARPADDEWTSRGAHREQRRVTDRRDTRLGGGPAAHPAHARAAAPAHPARQSGAEPADRAGRGGHRVRDLRRQLPAASGAVPARAADGRRRRARGGPDGDHPDRRHRPVHRHGDGAGVAGDGEAQPRPRRPRSDRAADRHRGRRC